MAGRPPRRATMPWDVPLLEVSEASAVKAMAAQHPGGFEVIMKICGLDRLSFTAGGDDGRRATDFAEGKRFVGACLRNTVTMSLPSPVRSAPPPDLPNSPTIQPDTEKT